MPRDELTPRERFLLTIAQKGVDRAPVTAYLDSLYAEKIAGKFGADLIGDVLPLFDRMGFDVMLRDLWPETEGVFEPKAWCVETKNVPVEGGVDECFRAQTPGGVLTWRARRINRKPGELPPYATVEYVIKDRKSWELYRQYAPRTRVKDLSGVRRGRKAVGERGIISNDMAGVFNNAVYLRGTENLLLDAMEDPEFYREQMTYQVENIKRMADGLAEDPPDLCRHYDNEANGAIMGAAFYREHVLPYEREVIAYAESKGIRVMLHNCGVMGELLAAYPETGATAVESFSPPPNGDTDFSRACKVLEGKMVRVGGIDQIHLLKSPDLEKIKAETRRAVEGLKGRSGYIACHSDQVDRDVSVEALLAYRDAAFEAARYA